MAEQPPEFAPSRSTVDETGGEGAPNAEGRRGLVASTPVGDEHPPTVRAVRGNVPLKDEDLQVHLALMVRTENIGVLLGAGASVCAGGWTMKEVWDHFTREYQNDHAWLVQSRFVADGEVPNIETLADRLAVASEEWERYQAASDSISGNAMGRKEQEGLDLGALERARAALFRSVMSGAVLNQEWWTAEATNEPAAALSDHRSLLTKLTRARQPGQRAPWFFTTNYDLAIEWAAETSGLDIVNGFGGVHRRTFRPGNFDLAIHRADAHGEARFGSYHAYLVKLHGSLCWRPAGERQELEAREDSAPAAFDALTAFLEGKSHSAPLLILPRTAKYFETTGYLYAEMFRRFAEYVGRTHSCMIACGYSFSDAHVNQMIIRGLQNPTFHLVAYVPEVIIGANGIENAPKMDVIADYYTSPQVTLIGNGSAAYFDRLIMDLPDPVLFTQGLNELRQQMSSKAIDR